MRTRTDGPRRAAEVDGGVARRAAEVDGGLDPDVVVVEPADDAIVESGTCSLSTLPRRVDRNRA